MLGTGGGDYLNPLVLVQQSAFAIRRYIWCNVCSTLEKEAQKYVYRYGVLKIKVFIFSLPAICSMSSLLEIERKERSGEARIPSIS